MSNHEASGSMAPSPITSSMGGIFTSASASVYSARHFGQRTLALLLMPTGSVTCSVHRGQDEIDIRPPESADHVKFSTGFGPVSTICDACMSHDFPVFLDK